MRLTCKTANGYCDMQIATRESKLEKLGQLEDIEEKTNIPFSQIASLKEGDVVYFKQNDLKVHEGTISSINFNELYITILDGKTFIDFMLFNQYGKDRKTPYHCWCGAWALTKEELEK